MQGLILHTSMCVSFKKMLNYLNNYKKLLFKMKTILKQKNTTLKEIF